MRARTLYLTDLTPDEAELAMWLERVHQLPRWRAIDEAAGVAHREPQPVPVDLDALVSA